MFLLKLFRPASPIADCHHHAGKVSRLGEQNSQNSLHIMLNTQPLVPRVACSVIMLAGGVYTGIVSSTRSRPTAIRIRRQAYSIVSTNRRCDLAAAAAT